MNRERPQTPRPAQQSRGARAGLQRLEGREVLKCAGQYCHTHLPRQSGGRGGFCIRLFEITVSNLGMRFNSHSFIQWEPFQILYQVLSASSLKKWLHVETKKTICIFKSIIPFKSLSRRRRRRRRRRRSTVYTLDKTLGKKAMKL